LKEDKLQPKGMGRPRVLTQGLRKIQAKFGPDTARQWFQTPEQTALSKGQPSPTPGSHR